MNKQDKKSLNFEAIVDSAFSVYELPDGVEIVDKLRNIELEHTTEEGNFHYIGASFAQDSENEDGSEEQGDSFRVSFHCEINPNGEVVHAYLYNCKNGNEIGQYKPS